MLSDDELLKLSPAELVDMGVCPTCLNRRTSGGLYGSNIDKLIYADDDIECFFVANPRAEGHMCISSVKHYHDLSEAPDELNDKIFRFAKQFMIFLVRVYGCERVYLCSMCDGPNNHYHIQLIPRYGNEKRGSQNFVKPRGEYVFNEEKFLLIKNLINEYSGVDCVKSDKILYNKIVRDNIPEIIVQSGKECEYKFLSEGDYICMIERKLKEEVDEYFMNCDVGELADVLEVVYAIAHARGVAKEQLEDMRRDKAAKRGGFGKRILLQSVTDKKCEI